MGYYLAWEFLGYISPYNANGYSAVTCNPNTGAITFSGSASLTPSSTSGSVIINSGGDPVELVASPSGNWPSYIAYVAYQPDPIYPSFSVGTPRSDGVELYVSAGNQGYTWFRVFCRRAVDTGATFEQWYNVGTSFTSYITGLDPNTAYVVNVGYNTTGPDTPSSWVGAQNFTTAQRSEKAYIYHNGTWTPATPYVYHNNTWVEAEPFIYSGGWK